jgi:hypothetical protein
VYLATTKAIVASNKNSQNVDTLVSVHNSSILAFDVRYNLDVSANKN